jgi:DNA-binding response OmpR family regulator
VVSRGRVDRQRQGKAADEQNGNSGQNGLTPQEYRLLAELWRQRGSVVPHAVLQDRLGGVVSRNNLRTLVHRLRRRVGPPFDIRTVHGVGYQLRDRRHGNVGESLEGS